MSRKRNPVGSPRRWREGHAQRVDPKTIAALEREFTRAMADKLSAQLRAKDIAQAELAAAIGVTAPSVMHWTSGRLTPPFRRLLAMTVALGCSLIDLLPDEVRLP